MSCQTDLLELNIWSIKKPNAIREVLVSISCPSIMKEHQHLRCCGLKLWPGLNGLGFVKKTLGAMVAR